MGCTYSKNSKSKAVKQKEERPLDRSLRPNRIPHFDETHKTTQSTSNESSDEKEQPVHYSKHLLNEAGGGVDETMTKETERNHAEGKKIQTIEHIQNIPPDFVQEPDESLPPTAAAPPPPPPTVAVGHQQQNFVASTYYPMPTFADKQKSPEKKKQRKREAPAYEEKRKEHARDKTNMAGTNYRPQLTAEDMECIKRSVQQRNERRAYMMANRKETDDTLYELESRMPEKDYMNRGVELNSRV